MNKKGKIKIRKTKRGRGGKKAERKVRSGEKTFVVGSRAFAERKREAGRGRKKAEGDERIV